MITIVRDFENTSFEERICEAGKYIVKGVLLVEKYSSGQIAKIFGVTAAGVRRRLQEDGVKPCQIVRKGLASRIFYGGDAIEHLIKIGWVRVDNQAV